AAVGLLHAKSEGDGRRAGMAPRLDCEEVGSATDPPGEVEVKAGVEVLDAGHALAVEEHLQGAEVGHPGQLRRADLRADLERMPEAGYPAARRIGMDPDP